MCMYVAHWNIFMVNKRDLQQKIKKFDLYKHNNECYFMISERESSFLSNHNNIHLLTLP